MSNAGIFGLTKGNKTGDFYSYNAYWGQYDTLAAIPPGPRGKLPYKGSCAVGDGDRYVYATKGNNTNEFYRYDIPGNSWTAMKDVPDRGSPHFVRDGSCLVWAESEGRGYAYLVKGGGFEFLRFNVAADSWETMRPAPAGNGRGWKSGSWLVYDGARTIYAHKGSSPDFFRYDIPTGVWSDVRLRPMPVPGSGGDHKMKNGSCAAWHDGRLFALKGNGTGELWTYVAARDSWFEEQPMPAIGSTGKKKMAKSGADIYSYEDGNVPAILFITKGNRTRELWLWEQPWGDKSACPGGCAECRAEPQDGPAAPDIIAGATRPAFDHGLRPTETGLLLDACGRRVRTLAQGANSLAGLPPGIYFLSPADRTPARKLVILH